MACDDFTEKEPFTLGRAYAPDLRNEDMRNTVPAPMPDDHNPPLLYKEVKDSGRRESFSTGAVRDTEEGKPRIDLLFKYIPMPCLMRITQHYVNGAKKYGDHNWQKGIPASRCISSAFRHLYQYLTGDRSEDHLSAVVFNVICILYWEETGNLKMQDVGGNKCPSK
jgi:hypothetical protein